MGTKVLAGPGPVEVEEIDIVGAQPPQALDDTPLHGVGGAVEGLVGYLDLLASWTELLTKELFGHSPAVDLGGVEMANTVIIGTLDEAVVVFLVLPAPAGAPVAVAEGPAAQPQFGLLIFHMEYILVIFFFFDYLGA